jgi:uncharacterized zinc-type alcohol dehydrogenase-like protein
MIKSHGYAAQDSKSALAPFAFDRRSPGPADVLIEILYCGVCHSDIHQARNEWGQSAYPMVPGHEIIGRVVETGRQAKKFKAGDLAGVGVFVDSCRTCRNCKEGLEQYCENHLSLTYNSTEQDQKTPTFGGYASNIVVDERYALRIPANLKLEAVAPLLCAGITTYSPLRHWKVAKGQKVGVLGLGGLGHMAVKFAASFGAEVFVFSSSAGKEADAKRLGAHHFVLSRDESAMNALARKLDFMIDCVSAPHNVNALLNLIRLDGTLAVVGLPEKPLEIEPFSLLGARRSVAGSGVGGMRETQEMLDYCGEHDIVSDVEMIAMQDINRAYERVVKGDVRYRFVIDMKSLSR